jgi:hypothetical protein
MVLRLHQSASASLTGADRRRCRGRDHSKNGDWSPRRPPEGDFVLLGLVSLKQNETVRTAFSSPVGLCAAFGRFGGKGIDLAALDPCFALELRSHPQKSFKPPDGGTGGKGIDLAALDPCFALELRSHPQKSFKPPDGGTGGKGIDLAALDPCFALELRSHPQKSFKPPDGGTGGKGIRTPGLLIANETLYQLSYTPAKKRQ